jgi:hypothetical protein
MRRLMKRTLGIVPTAMPGKRGQDNETITIVRGTDRRGGYAGLEHGVEHCQRGGQ